MRNKYSVQKIPTDILHQTAENHRTLRKRLKWSQVEMAERSGVSLGSLKRFERTGQISFESLLKLAHVLDRLPDFEKVFQPLEGLEEVEKLFSDEMRNPSGTKPKK